MSSAKPRPWLQHLRRTPRVAAVALAALAVACAHTIAVQQQQSRQRAGAVDWILVVDTSASMRGAGGSANIFPQVKRALSDFVRNARPGDTFTIYSFDRDTELRPTVRVADDTDVRDLLQTVEGLQANGDRTHTGKAIRDALTRAAELGRRADAAERTPSVVLLTDGLEDVRGIPDPVSIPSNIELIRNTQPYIFFVSLGAREHERQLEEFVRDPAVGGRGEVVRDPGALELEELSARIRKKIEEEAPPTPAPTPVEVSLRVQPSSLDFGQVGPGGRTGRQELKVTATAAARVRLSLRGEGSSQISFAEPEGGAFDAPANEETEIDLRLAASESARDERLDLQLVLTPEPVAEGAAARASAVGARLEVYQVPLWRKLLKWLAILLILLLLVVVALSLYKGKLPWELASDWKSRNWLGGEIELIRPAPPRHGDTFVSLHALKTDRVLLSGLVPGGVAGVDADAELTTETKRGVKQINLRRTAGVVRVNGAEVALAPLYDGDIIELGQTVRLRFNRVGHERPVEADENF